MLENERLTWYACEHDTERERAIMARPRQPHSPGGAPRITSEPGWIDRERIVDGDFFVTRAQERARHMLEFLRENPGIPEHLQTMLLERTLQQLVDALDAPRFDEPVDAMLLPNYTRLDGEDGPPVQYA